MTGSRRPEPRARDPFSRRPAKPGSPAGRARAVGPGSLYERYKDALRRGHVATLRGRYDAAIDAYGEAASIAPDRPLPHASIAGILARMNRADEAIAAYRRALAVAPRDEAALRGIADVLATLGRQAEAAAALDRLAEGLDAAGRLADATDTARRALELAESRPRRTQVETLVERLRTTAADDDAAKLAIAAALAVLGPATALGDDTPASQALPEPASGSATVGEGDTSEGGVSGPQVAVAAEGTKVGPDVVDTAGVPDRSEPDQIPEPPPSLGAEAAVGVGAEGPIGPDLAVAAGSAETTEREPLEVVEPELVEPAGLGIALGAVAEAQLHAGQLEAAREGLLAAARAHRRAGRLIAAVDACDLAIGVAPADPDLHLLLAELYLDRGWRGLAADKLLLLGQIADLDGDAATRDRLCAIVTARLADEPRLAELCA